MTRWVHMPAWVRRVMPSALFRYIADTETVYLTFDDGPVPGVTDVLLDILAEYNAHATFFCVGDNVRKHPDLYARILEEGHQVGNHTYHHLNGWAASTAAYIKDVQSAREYVDSTWFRPPYGKCTPRQYKRLRQAGYQIVLWDVLTYDFDPKVTPTEAVENITKYAQPGSIIVLHDNEKTRERVPKITREALTYFHQQGWQAASLPSSLA